jgi:hypothetical protein
MLIPRKFTGFVLLLIAGSATAFQQPPSGQKKNPPNTPPGKQQGNPP